MGAAFRAAALLLFIALSPCLQAQTLGEEVNHAIKQGVAFLRTKLQDKGSFDTRSTHGYPDGATALCLLAMLKSSVQASDPAVLRVLAYLRYKPYVHTYSTAVRILAMDALKDKQYDKPIQDGARWLADQFRTGEKLWAYPDRASDLSNTQYAVLGLWTAERRGYEAPREIWTALAPKIMLHQNRDGGFGYQIGRKSTGSMTTAGITVLEICKLHFKKNAPLARRIEESLDRAWAFLDRRFNPAGNPKGERFFIRSYYYYYIYGLERACALGDRKKLGDRDWYLEGASELVKTQRDDGSWEGDGVDTSFALLFLRLSTYTSLKRKHDSNMNATGKGKKKRLTPQVRIPFVKQWLLLGPISDPKETGLAEALIPEEKAAPRHGQAAARFKWFTHKETRNFVDLDSAFSGKDNAVAYAFTYLRVLEDREARLWVGHNDGIRIRLDGELILDYPFEYDAPQDRHNIPVTLTRGVHRLLVKVKDFSGKWGFMLRMSDRDGAPLTGVIPTLHPDEPTLVEILEAGSGILQPDEIHALLPLDKKGKLDFSSLRDLQRVLIVQCRDEPTPAWAAAFNQATGIRPNPGAKGILCVHPLDQTHPCRIYRKVRIPTQRSRVVLRLSACSSEHNANADWKARIGVYDGTMAWLKEKVIAAGAKSSPLGWYDITVNVGDYAGRKVLVILECAAGGPGGDWSNENAFIDEFSIK